MSNTTIQLRKSGQTGNTPADLAHGELAINYADGKLFYKNGVGIKSIENQKTFSTVNSNNSLIIASSPTDILNVVPGNNITISTNTTSKTVTLNVRNNLNVETLNVRSTSWFSGDLIVSNGAGLGGSKEGGEIKLATATQDSSLAPGTVSIDIYENKLRIFETGGANRGVFIDLANGAASSVGTNLISVGAASGVSSIGGAIGAISNNQVLSFVQAVSSTAGITFDYVATANNGQGTNFKVGDDAWIGDTNLANAIRIRGQQDSTQGYILFGSNDGKLLGRSGSGALTYDANTIWNAGNDGPGSGLDADTLDGLQALSFANNTFTQAAFNSANAGVTLATAAYAQANSASSNTVYLNEINTLQNTNITSVNTFAGSAFNSANAGVTLATAAYTQANNASGNTVALQTINNLQNTNITSVNTFAGSAFNSANAGVALATSAYAQANNASGNTVALQAVNATQNTNITSVNTFTQAAYNTANLKFNTTGGTITGNVTVQNNLVVQGNLSVLGNSTTITTGSLSITDSLIFLANGNFTTDAVDIGLIGHYGGPSGETHTGIFRDANLKEWIIFEGYTEQIQANNLINIANPTFAYANLYANVVKANLISTRATVNGLDVFSTMTNAWNSANAGVTLATAAYAQANNASGNTVALQAVNTTQNTNITSINTFAGSAFNSANAGVTLATAAYAQANNASGNTVALQSQMTTTNTNITSVNTFAQSAFNSANAGVTLATAAYAQANNASGNTVALQTINNLQNTNITSINTFAQAGFNKANGVVQTGFTTIAANSINITPTSNADTLTITAGNNISISACTTTRTVTIASTASGGGGGAGTVTSVSGTGTASGLTLSGTVTTSGSLTLSGTVNSLATASNYQVNSLGVGTAASGTAGEIRATNNITAYFSDKRLKTNIRSIDNPLGKLSAISGVYYNANDVAESFGYTDKSEQVGVIAQEVQKILPHVVKPAPFDIDYDENRNQFSKSGKNYLTVQYEKLIPLLIECIKEQQKQIDELKEKINKK